MFDFRQIDALIKEDNEASWAKARKALRRLLKMDGRSVEGWWRYAQIAPDLKEACMALENVLVLDPNHPNAADALAILRRRMAEQSNADT